MIKKLLGIVPKQTEDGTFGPFGLVLKRTISPKTNSGREVNKSPFSLGILVLSVLAIFGCGKNDGIPSNVIGKANPELGITNIIPSSLGSDYKKYFNRYTQITTPNGGTIHIVAQSLITDEQIVRCRNILQHFLTDFPNSQYGSNKSAIANKMAENGAVLTLLNGKDDGSQVIEVDGQPLYQNEIQVEGHSWYMNQDYEHRDAAYEEILHLVHDYGIGVDGEGALPAAASVFQSEIRAAQQNALYNHLWGMGNESWIQELTAENSLSQEYLASVVDSYYGLWGAWTESHTHGMWGLYVGKTRADMPADDPIGHALASTFFHPYFTYNARIDAGLNGHFSLRFDVSNPYTHHSRYLKDITLLGNHNNSVTVNELNNEITGNLGINTVVFSGSSTEYDITKNNNIITVNDSIPNRDGKNRLNAVEKLQFTNTTVDL